MPQFTTGRFGKSDRRSNETTPVANTIPKTCWPRLPACKPCCGKPLASKSNDLPGRRASSRGLWATGRPDPARFMKPKRIQLRRIKGWRMPPNTVKVCRPTKWGNPYIVGKDGNQLSCAFKFHVLMCGRMANDENKSMRDSAQKELAGKNLACWCKPGEPCHADTILAVANKWGRWSDDYRDPCLDCGNPVENRKDTWCKECQASGKPAGAVMVCVPQPPIDFIKP